VIEYRKLIKMKKDTSKPKKEEKKVEEKKEVVEEKKEPVFEVTGYDRFEYSNGITYIGNWKQTNKGKVKEGYGKLTHVFTNIKVPLTEWYEGEWSNDMMNGYGVYKYASGATYSGNWKNNRHEGYGVYVMADSCKYEGEWLNHRFNGTGTFTDLENMRWTGEFVNGSYDTKSQKKLQAERAIINQVIQIEKSSKGMFTDFLYVYSQSDKKSFRENLSQFFASVDSMVEFINEPYPKITTKTVEEWANIITLLKDSPDTHLNVLKHAKEARLIEVEKIRGEQLSCGGGQVVETELNLPNDRFIKMALSQTKEHKWVICFYQDNLESAQNQKK
jgi:hypothetical protein